MRARFGGKEFATAVLSVRFLREHPVDAAGKTFVRTPTPLPREEGWLR